jgi:hypothetical protein
MTMKGLPGEGGCRCGQVRFRIGAAPLLTMACHCTGCQKMTSSAFSLSVLVPSDAFEVTAGEPAIGGLHAETRHFFCPHCMSWMFTRPQGADHVVNVRATLLDDATGFTPFMETFTRERLAWATTPAVRSFDGFPAFEDYQELIQAYAASRA